MNVLTLISLISTIKALTCFIIWTHPLKYSKTSNNFGTFLNTNSQYQSKLTHSHSYTFSYTYYIGKGSSAAKAALERSSCFLPVSTLEKIFSCDPTTTCTKTLEVSSCCAFTLERRSRKASEIGVFAERLMRQHRNFYTTQASRLVW